MIHISEGYNTLTRVEGEGKILLKTVNNKVVDVEIVVSEAPRFFEYLVLGKPINMVVDTVSRICGLCGSSYSLAAATAFETCLEVEARREAVELRKALHLAERVKSHIIHIFLLNLPDYLGVPSILEAQEIHPVLLREVFNILSWSRRAMEVLGGRFHNVLNIRVGGVYRAPERNEVAKLLKKLEKLIPEFEAIADFVLSIDKSLGDAYVEKQLALYNGNEYPHIGLEVRAVGENLGIGLKDFENYLKVEQKPWSNALHYRLPSGESYLVGPIARYNLAFSYLQRETRDLMKVYGWTPPIRNVFQSIVARIAEVHDSLLRLREFLENYREFDPKPTPQIQPMGIGGRRTCIAAIEAPRGILYHRYDLDENGRVVSCNIIAPTAQNLAAMEDLAKAKAVGEEASRALREWITRLIRSFDPCISCSVHVVRLKQV
ncbi:MAG: hypothetical protein DRO13_06055 [Thermoprotei archaeon]|nr:MAG: hypothetical protein DRO13_06055 [Thermoprotei archaeon]